MENESADDARWKGLAVEEARIRCPEAMVAWGLAAMISVDKVLRS